MAKEKKRCKECEGKGKDECECPKKARKGWYGLERHNDDDDDDATLDPDHSADSGDGGGLGEAVRMPRRPQDSDKDMEGMSRQRKEKKLSDFRAAADAAKKRQNDENRKGELAAERRTKGIRFFDAKGSGYIKGGKKTYD